MIDNFKTDLLLRVVTMCWGGVLITLLLPVLQGLSEFQSVYSFRPCRYCSKRLTATPVSTEYSGACRLTLCYADFG